MYYTEIASPFGSITLTANHQGLTALAFQQGAQPLVLTGNDQRNDDYFAETKQQLTEYFAGSRKTFELKLAPHGTNFQQRVWQMLCQIPYGETVSYAWLANKIGNDNAVRAVGSANGKNPIAVIIPCHRVIGKNGKLTGYAGGLDLKAQLLAHEGGQYIAE